MKKLMSILVCIALLTAGVLVFAGCAKDPGEATNAGGIAGGWTKADSPEITDEFRAVFHKATEALTGEEYTPVAYLASQVAAGKNHRVLCKAAATVPDAEARYVIVTVYENLRGGAEITGVAECGVSASYPDGAGGWSEPATPAVTDDARSSLEKACETLTGEEYTPVAYLAAQVVAGTNYRILCEARATVPDAEVEYVIVTVYADLQGNAQIVETAEFEENATGMPNPLVEYGSDMQSLDAAEQAVGFTLELPETVNVENFIAINGEILEVRFDGGYLRKAAGDGDISGDYNDYAVTETKTADGKEITLKGSADQFMLAIWSESGYTYCIGVTDGVSETEMLSLVGATK